MSVRDSGWQPDQLAAALDHVDALLDQAAQAHAEALVAVAPDFSRIKHLPYRIEAAGVGVRTITDPGMPMSWLQGKGPIPLRGVTEGGRQAFRIASARSLAAGHWRYPGRLAPLEAADRDPRVRAVAEEQRRRINGEG
jgi:hypothetical protein